MPKRDPGDAEKRIQNLTEKLLAAFEELDFQNSTLRKIQQRNAFFRRNKNRNLYKQTYKSKRNTIHAFCTRRSGETRKFQRWYKKPEIPFYKTYHPLKTYLIGKYIHLNISTFFEE